MATLGYWNRKRIPVSRERPTEGAALYFWIWRYHGWDMILLNCFVLLCSLPVVTAPAAWSAMNRCLYRILDDQPQMLWQAFRETLLAEWKKSLLAAIPMVIVQVLLILLGGFFQERAVSGWAVLAAWIGQITLVMVGAYVYAMVPYLALSVGQCYRNALLLLLVCIWRNVLTALLLLALTMGLVLLYPALYAGIYFLYRAPIWIFSGILYLPEHSPVCGGASGRPRGREYNRELRPGEKAAALPCQTNSQEGELKPRI